MTDEQKLELLFDMTSHPGWLLLVEDLEARVEAMKEGLVRNESSPYQVGMAQGHVKVYREFIHLRTMIEQMREQMKDNETDSI